MVPRARAARAEPPVRLGRRHVEHRLHPRRAARRQGALPGQGLAAPAAPHRRAPRHAAEGRARADRERAGRAVHPRPEQGRRHRRRRGRRRPCAAGTLPGHARRLRRPARPAAAVLAEQAADRRAGAAPPLPARLPRGARGGPAHPGRRHGLRGAQPLARGAAADGLAGGLLLPPRAAQRAAQGAARGQRRPRLTAALARLVSARGAAGPGTRRVAPSHRARRRVARAPRAPPCRLPRVPMHGPARPSLYGAPRQRGSERAVRFSSCDRPQPCFGHRPLLARQLCSVFS
mmetsp:Transcript_11385/g.28508  ORF Transcript_11385/g.28508 Transcript_11385/m.28508 type:complete len:289 (+) Transcript_11385:791-1657(+)